MKFIITPTYKEIFGDEIPSFDQLIKGIPTRVILGVVSVINAELYLSTGDPVAQQRILSFLLRRQNQKTINRILSRVYASTRDSKGNGVAIFSTHLTLEFLHQALLHFHEDESFLDTNPSQELTIFKAYLLISEKVNSQTNLTKDSSSPLDYYRKNTWPTHINQLEVNHPINYLTSIVKSKSFFDFLEFESAYSEFVNSFLSEREYKNSWSYIFNLGQLIQNSTTQQNNEGTLSPFYIKIKDQSFSWLNEMCLDLISYKEKFKSGKRNNDGFKDKPLVKFQSNSFLVIDWNLFANKIYNGLIYDFFTKSGISELSEFKSKENPFIAFKKIISEFSIENYLFKNLIRGIFKGKQTAVVFDEREKQGFPDAYVRVGKRIFVFEIKDAFFPSKTVESYDYNLIKLKIDEKYNTDKKGTGQLIKHIRNLQNDPYENRSYAELKLKSRNLIIYPIMVYTDTFYSMPGVSLYLQESFNDRIREENLTDKFEIIKPLTFFNIDFLINNLDLLQNKDYSLDKVIDYVTKTLNIARKNHEKYRTIEALFELNDNFESIASRKMERKDKKSRNYVQVIFDELNLDRRMS